MKEALNPKQRQAALLLALGQTQRQVAESIEVSYQTVNLWTFLPAFHEQKMRDMNDINTAMINASVRLRLKALGVVEALLDHEEPATRLQAARCALSAHR